MTAPTMPRRRLTAALLGFALVAGACGRSAATAAPVTPVPTIAPATASPMPAPTATPTIVPTPTAAATAIPAASASAAVDPAAGLAIAAPYVLVDPDPATAAAIQSSIEQGMGAFASLIHVGTRQVTNSGKLAAYLMVMQFPSGVLTATTYQAVLGGISASSKASFKANTVSGTTVSTGTLSTVNVGVFRSGDHVVLVLALAKDDVLPISKALITAN